MSYKHITIFLYLEVYGVERKHKYQCIKNNYLGHVLVEFNCSDWKRGVRAE